MLQINYRHDKDYKGIDIHFEDYLLPEVLKSVINSVEPYSVIFLRIQKSYIEETKTDKEKENARVHKTT